VKTETIKNATREDDKIGKRKLNVNKIVIISSSLSSSSSSSSSSL